MYTTTVLHTMYMLLCMYKAGRPEKLFFLASICRANTDLPVKKIWLWASFGV